MAGQISGLSLGDSNSSLSEKLYCVNIPVWMFMLVELILITKKSVPNPIVAMLNVLAGLSDGPSMYEENNVVETYG